MKSRSIGVLLSSAVVAVAITSCSAGGGDGDTVIEFQTAQAADSPLLAVLEEQTAAFEADNPGVDIDLKTAGDDYESQIKVRLAARDAPDIWATHGWSLLRYSDFLAPLEDEPWAESFNEVLAPAMQDDDGSFYALPVTAATSGLIVNRTVLEETGVDIATLDTWEGLEAAAERVAGAGVTPFYLAGSKDGSAGNVIDWLAPGAFTEDELAAFADGEFDTDAYEELLTVLDDMRERGWTNVDYTAATGDDMARALAEGKGAFALTSNALISLAWGYVPDADLTYVPVPPIIGGEPYLIGGEDTAFGVARDGEHVDVAKEYLAFLAQPENMTELARAVGNPPGLTDAEPDLGPLSDPYEQYVATGAVPLSPFFDRVSLPNGMWDTVVTTADGVIAGQTSPRQGAEKMSSDFSTLFEQAE